MNYIEVLEGNCWSLICESYSNGEDASTGWVVVAYFMAEPFERVVGYSDESQGPTAAIEMAVKITEHDSYNFLHAYEPR